jgi:two-component system response regulator CitB
MSEDKDLLAHFFGQWLDSNMTANVRVLIIEDVDEMLALMVQALEGTPGIQISGQAHNLWEARLELDRRRPDLILLDEILPGESAVDFTAEMVAEGIPVLLITSMEDPNHPLIPGAKGRVQKPGWKTLSTDKTRLIRAIRLVFGSEANI